jgi:hypothetical protein
MHESSARRGSPRQSRSRELACRGEVEMVAVVLHPRARLVSACCPVARRGIFPALSVGRSGVGCVANASLQTIRVRETAEIPVAPRSSRRGDAAPQVRDARAGRPSRARAPRRAGFGARRCCASHRPPAMTTCRRSCASPEPADRQRAEGASGSPRRTRNRATATCASVSAGMRPWAIPGPERRALSHAVSMPRRLPIPRTSPGHPRSPYARVPTHPSS